MGEPRVVEIRKPRPEIRRKSENRNPKRPVSGTGESPFPPLTSAITGPVARPTLSPATLCLFSGFGFRISFGSRISDFGFGSALLPKPHITAAYRPPSMPTLCWPSSDFGFRNSFGSRISDFGFVPYPSPQSPDGTLPAPAVAHSAIACDRPHSGQRVTGNCAPHRGQVACVSNVSNCVRHLSQRQS